MTALFLFRQIALCNRWIVFEVSLIGTLESCRNLLIVKKIVDIQMFF